MKKSVAGAFLRWRVPPEFVYIECRWNLYKGRKIYRRDFFHLKIVFVSIEIIRLYMRTV